MLVRDPPLRTALYIEVLGLHLSPAPSCSPHLKTSFEGQSKRDFSLPVHLKLLPILKFNGTLPYADLVDELADPDDLRSRNMNVSFIFFRFINSSYTENITQAFYMQLSHLFCPISHHK